MLYYPQTSFDAQAFLENLDLNSLICKSCPRAKTEKEYGKIKGFCGDIGHLGNPLYPTDYLCPMHDVFSKIEDAACELEEVIYQTDKLTEHDVIYGESYYRR